MLNKDVMEIINEYKIDLENYEKKHKSYKYLINLSAVYHEKYDNICLDWNEQTSEPLCDHYYDMLCLLGTIIKDMIKKETDEEREKICDYAFENYGLYLED
jgi:hypothetical protein